MDSAPEPFRFGFYFARHGQTRANRLGIRAGSDHDSPLTDAGRCQASRIAFRLHQDDLPPPDAIYTAGNRRTLSTVRIINHRLGLKSNMCQGLRERRLGVLNHLPVSLTEPFIAGGRTPHGGETNREFRRRVLDAIAEVVGSGHQRPLVVSSRGVARILFSHIGCAPGDVTNGRLFFVGLSPDDACQVTSVHDVSCRPTRPLSFAPGRSVGRST